MRRTMHLPPPRRAPGSAPTKAVVIQNMRAIRTPPGVPMPRLRRADLELLDRIAIWINEGGAGGDVQ